MDNSTINLIFFLVFAVGIIIIIWKLLSSSPEEIDKMVNEANKRRSDAIKRGIAKSRLKKKNNKDTL